MSVQGPSAPILPSSSIAPDQERTPSPPNSLGDAPIINPSSGKKTTSKKKASKRKATGKAKSVKSVDTPAPRRARYEPYRRAEPTPEREANLPADPEELETLDATAKKLYRSDREVLEYIESLKNRTAAVLEHVNRTDSQLRSCKGAMERIQLFASQWQKMGDHWTHEQLFGNGNFRARWEDGKMEVLDSDEEDEEDDAPNPDLFPTLTRDENGAFPTIQEHLSRNTGHPNFPHDYARDFLGESAPQLPDDDEDFIRPETPPARQPSLPPGHEDENGLEYVEDERRIQSDFPAPPDHTDLASDDSTFDRSGADLRIASDTGILRPPSDEEFTRISKEFKREAMELTALTARPSTNPPRPLHPLAQSHIPSSPEPQPLVVPHPVPRTPPSSRTVLTEKRKRVLTFAEEENVAENIAGPSTIFHPGIDVPRQIEAKDNEDRPLKRQRLISYQPIWDSRTFPGASFVPNPPCADPPARETPLDPPSQPAHGQASPSPTATSQIQKEDSEIERSQVIEMLSQGAERVESEDEEPTGNILGGLGESQHTLPALTPDDTQATSISNTRSEVETPAESQVPADAPASIPEDVFGPIVLSAKAGKISDVFRKDAGGDATMSDSGRVAAKISSKSTRFSFDGMAEKEHKVFPKTPMRPGTSLEAIQAGNVLPVDIEAESQDVLKPLSSPKKKRVLGGRARKPKSLIEAEPTVNPEGGLPSISASKPPSKRRRGRSASVQPEIPAPPRTPVRKSTRSKK